MPFIADERARLNRARFLQLRSEDRDRSTLDDRAPSVPGIYRRRTANADGPDGETWAARSAARDKRGAEDRVLDLTELFDDE